MNIVEWEKQLETVLSIVARLEAHQSNDSGAQILLHEALEELHVTLEELTVTSEELHQQQSEISDAYQRVEAEHRRYHDLFEFAPDGYLVSDASGRLVEANAAAGEMLNQQVQYLPGQILLVYVLAEDQPQFLDLLRRLADGEAVRAGNLRMRPVGGNSFNVAILAQPVRAADGQVENIRWMLRDVSERVAQEQALQASEAALAAANTTLEQRVAARTAELQRANAALQAEIAERKQAEERLRKSQARLQAVYDNAAAGICHFTLAGQWLAVNQRCLRMFGYAEEELLALNFLDVVHPADRTYSIDLFAGLSWHDQQSYRIERRYVRQDGSIFWGDMSLTAICDGAGQVESILGVLVNITRSKEAEAALQQANQRLQQQSIRDGLTGLHNRRYLDEMLARELQRAARAGQPLGLIMLDIDHFKYVNDRYGHDAGDVLLRALGVFLQQNIRGEDIACRYGGEEFALVLPGASADDTRQRALEICEGVRRLVFSHAEQQLPGITVSVGVAGCSGESSSPEQLVRAADQALYQAKRSGRNQVIVARQESVEALER